MAPLPADAVDAALDDQSTPSMTPSTSRDPAGLRREIITTLSTQLEVLEAQRKQLQRLLDEAEEI